MPFPCVALAALLLLQAMPAEERVYSHVQHSGAAAASGADAEVAVADGCGTEHLSDDGARTCVVIQNAELAGGTLFSFFLSPPLLRLFLLLLRVRI